MHKQFLFSAVAIVFTLMSCRSTEQRRSDASTWPGQMQNMAQDVKKLLPYIYDRQAFQDPANRERISQALKDFVRVTHKIDPQAGKKFISDDLLLESTMGNLQEDLKRAQDGFAMGQFEYSRSVTKSALGHCFRCHSVTKEGNTSVWDVGEIHKLNLAPLEKADLLVAARKFDQATTYMESLLKSDEFLANHAFDFEALLRRYLALMIRVESDPERAMQGLEQVLEKGNTPHYIVDQAEGWRKSLQRWASEKKSPIKSAKELFKRVENHFKRAESLQNYEKDHAGDVEYLRITSLLHEGLKLTKEPKDQARALYLLGRAYEVLDELGSWNLHENYYESCVLKAPKSPVARRCYSRLEASLYMGYSGSSGTHLPGDVKKRLQFLKQKL